MNEDFEIDEENEMTFMTAKTNPNLRVKLSLCPRKCHLYQTTHTFNRQTVTGLKLERR